MVRRTWRVYGREGHRQKESFEKSYVRDFSLENGNHIRVLNVKNSDVTHTNEYTEIEVFRDTKEQCQEEIDGQVSDGIFENCGVGELEEIGTAEEITVWKVYPKCVVSAVPVEDITYIYEMYLQDIAHQRWTEVYGKEISLDEDCFSQEFVDDVYDCYVKELIREFWQTGSISNGRFKVVMMPDGDIPKRPDIV